MADGATEEVRAVHEVLCRVVSDDHPSWAPNHVPAIGYLCRPWGKDVQYCSCTVDAESDGLGCGVLRLA